MDVTGLVKVGVLLGLLIVAESLFLLYIGFSYFGLYDNIDQLHTFIFDWLTLSGYFTVMVVRERKHFWESKPSKPLILSILINSIIVVSISIIGMPELTAVTPIQLLTVFAYSFVTCLLLNDFVKVFMTRRLGAIL